MNSSETAELTPELRLAWLNADDRTLEKDCALSFCKGSGNGGQKINKTSSAVRLIHSPTGLTITENGSRSQLENRHRALKKLRMAIALECHCSELHALPPETLAVLPSPENTMTFPPFLAILFDHLNAAGYDLSRAADTLGITRNKLEKILRRDDSVWTRYLQKRNRQSFPPAIKKQKTERSPTDSSRFRVNKKKSFIRRSP